MNRPKPAKIINAPIPADAKQTKMPIRIRTKPPASYFPPLRCVCTALLESAAIGLPQPRQFGALLETSFPQSGHLSSGIIPSFYRVSAPNYNPTKLYFVYFGSYPGNVLDKRNARCRRFYREYNSTMSCSLTIGCISSRKGMCATLPLSASRSAVSQSGTGAIWVSSRLRRTS